VVHLEHMRVRLRAIQKRLQERLLLIHSGETKPSKRGLNEGLAGDTSFHFDLDAPATKQAAFKWKREFRCHQNGKSQKYSGPHSANQHRSDRNGRQPIHTGRSSEQWRNRGREEGQHQLLVPQVKR
jgi:hypothetical protein